jgi:pyruvate,water dikinase
LFDVVRQLVFRLGEVYTKKGWLNEPGDIFFLDWEEAVKGENHHQWKSAVAQRKLENTYFESIQPPAFFKVVSGKWPNLEEQQDASPSLEGMVASQGVVTGKVRVIEDFEMPEEIDFDILVTRRTDPGWTPLIALSKGLIVEHGGILSHAAIVARELDKPTLIGVKGVCNSLKTGDVVRLDARTGLVVKLSSVSE